MRLDSVLCRLRLRFSLSLAALLLLSVAGLRAQPNQPIRVLAPTTGQNLVVDTTYKVIWTTTSAVTGTLVIEYSTDSAVTWTQIDTAAPVGGADTLSWTVPNATTSNAYVRVRETGSARSGRSGRFTIVALPVPLIQVLYPNGGQNQTFLFDSTANIRWYTEYVSGQLKVQYSVDSGTTWTGIDTVTARAGNDTLSWTIPRLATTRGLVRVATLNDSTSDRSNNYFTLRAPDTTPTIVVQSPNGNNVFVFDSNARIRWSTANVTGQLKVQYSVDSGTTWTGIDTVTARAGNDTLFWTVPHTATTRALVRVATLNDATSDRSNNVFAIVAPDTGASITVQSPNGNNVFVWDSTARIRWSTANVTGQLKVQYSVDSGATWRGIDTVPARAGNDTLVWVVPHDSTVRAFVRVATLNDSTSDRSNRPFAIIPPDTLPSIRVINPNGGNVFGWDSVVAIRWTSTNVTGQLKVHYSLDSGATWIGLDTVPARAGTDTLYWTIPHENTTRALVRVATLNDSTSDRSNTTFTIKSSVNPRVHVLYANGGETLVIGQKAVLSWEAEDLSGPVVVQLSRDNGTSWVNIGFKTAINGVDTLNWTVTGPSTDMALVRVGNAQGTVRDTSDALFAIVDPLPGTIRLLYPNGGETFRADTTITIQWIDSNVTGSMLVAYSTNGGSTWNVFDTVAPANGANSTTWTVPNNATTNALITVAGPGGDPFDQCDGAFTILARPAGVEDVVAGMLASRVVPNPARGEVTLGWTQFSPSTASVRLYNLRGLLVQTIDLGHREAGEHQAALDLSSMPAGSYRYELRCGAMQAGGIITLVR